jgi:hypothetical protein
MPRGWLILICVVIAISGVSCGRSGGHAPTVEYVVPAQYRGVVEVHLQAPGGSIPEAINGRHIIEIPASGTVHLGRVGRLLHDWHYVRASYATGERLPVGRQDEVAADTIALWQAGDGGDNIIILFVGTEEEWEAADKEMTRRLLRPDTLR